MDTSLEIAVIRWLEEHLRWNHGKAMRYGVVWCQWSQYDKGLSQWN